MPLFATIKSEGSELNLPNNVLANYYFCSDTSGYAKAYTHYIKLHLDIDVLALLSNGPSSVEENKELLENIRAWGNLRYSGNGSSYYRHVNLTHTHGDELFREIELTHAYVENFSETVELGKRKHLIRLELLQKEEFLRYVE